jgi:putative peptide zinc metalloprotease protein
MSDSQQDILVAGASRPLRIRMRPDLFAQRQSFGGRPFTVVKDPSAMRYFRLEEIEFAVLELLDGERSLAEILQEIERKFPREQITVEALHRYITTLYERRLVLSEAAGQGLELCSRGSRERRRRLFGQLAGVLSIRFRGINPERMLSAIYPWVRFCFTPAACLLGGLLILGAAALVLLRFDAFVDRLPDANEFFAPRTALSLLVAMAGLKVVHELGHGLACHHFGRRCHELGVMLLIFTPCLYCNVSDSWLLPNKWQRAMIAAAGMAVEMVIAAACTLLWWFSDEGLLHQCCFSLMTAGSIATLLFNANPLLKFDGYYILCDLCEAPGLARRSGDVLRRATMSALFGYSPADDRLLQERHATLLGVYGALAKAYRVFMVFSITWFLYQGAKSYGIESLVVMLVGSSLVGLSLNSGRRALQFWTAPGLSRSLNLSRSRVTALVFASLVLAFFALPVPYSVTCPFEIRPRNAVPVYVTLGGTLVEVHVRPGDRVRAGQELATLENLEARLVLTEISRQFRRQQVVVEDLERRRSHGDEDAQLGLAAATKELKSLAEHLKKKQQDILKLSLRAPADGVVIRAPRSHSGPTEETRLATWIGTPLDRENRGCLLQPGDVFCLISNSSDAEAVMTVREADVARLREGQDVALQWDAWPARRSWTQLEAVSHHKLDAAPERISSRAGGSLAVTLDPTGLIVPVETVYQASAPIQLAGTHIRSGLRGAARIRTGSATLAYRLGNFLAETFHFRL